MRMHSTESNCASISGVWMCGNEEFDVIEDRISSHGYVIHAY